MREGDTYEENNLMQRRRELLGEEHEPQAEESEGHGHELCQCGTHVVAFFLVKEVRKGYPLPAEEVDTAGALCRGYESYAAAAKAAAFTGGWMRAVYL